MVNHYPVIDADAHVEEWEATFSDRYWPSDLSSKRPLVTLVEGQPMWWIEGSVFPKLTGKGCHVFGTPASANGVLSVAAANKLESLDSQELRDPKARVADLDREGIDLQVLYPTLFVAAYSLASDPRLEVALYQAYNRWIDDAVGNEPRLKWVAVVTLTDVAAAVKEVEWARAAGAVGVMTLGTVRDEPLDRPAFDPFFSALEAHRLPLIIHVGWSAPGLNQLFDTNFTAITFPFRAQVQIAFVHLIAGGVLDRHPHLKVGFFEAGVGWVPYWLEIMEYYFDVRRRRPGLPFLEYRAQERPSEYIRRGQCFFGIEEYERLLPATLEMIGDEAIVWASDIPHNDREPEAAHHFANHPQLNDVQKRKILADNARRFYGLS
ncbi:MAG: amidohydrolase [Firmicutes bacterium]|nr:amidohydrolase [Bacillota bacterium]